MRTAGGVGHRRRPHAWASTRTRSWAACSGMRRPHRGAARLGRPGEAVMSDATPSRDHRRGHDDAARLVGVGRADVPLHEGRSGRSWNRRAPSPSARWRRARPAAHRRVKEIKATSEGAARREALRALSKAYLKTLAEAGMTGALFPEAYGGNGRGVVAECLIDEELAAAGHPGDIIRFVSLTLGTISILRYGNEAQKRRHIPPRCAATSWPRSPSPSRRSAATPRAWARAPCAGATAGSSTGRSASSRRRPRRLPHAVRDHRRRGPSPPGHVHVHRPDGPSACASGARSTRR